MLISFTPSLPCHILQEYVLERYLGLFPGKESLAHPLPPNFKCCLLLVKYPYCSRWGMLLPNCQICYSSIVYNLFCHCLVRVKRCIGFVYR
jgi:hypothetical protein